MFETAASAKTFIALRVKDSWRIAEDRHLSLLCVRHNFVQWAKKIITKREFFIKNLTPPTLSLQRPQNVGYLDPGSRGRKELILNVKFWLFCRYIYLSSPKQLQMGAFLVLPLPTTLGGWLKLSKPVKKASPVLIDSIVSCLHVKKFNSYSLVFFPHNY